MKFDRIFLISTMKFPSASTRLFTFVLDALVIFFCSNFIVSWPAGKFVMFEMFDILIGGLIL